jgi:hypothetical protein
LRAGSYGGVDTLSRLAADGASGARITVTSFPGEVATVVGWVDVEGSYTTLSHLRIDGSNTFYRAVTPGISCRRPVSQGLVIAGHDDVFEYNNLYQSVAGLRGNGIGIGWWGNPDNTVVRFNKIHDTGQCDQFDHSIYLAHGNNVQVYDNWIWSNHGGQAFSIYPGATNAQIYANVIDGSDSGFTIGDDGSSQVNGIRIFHNVVTNSGRLSNPDLGWSMPGVFINCAFASSSSAGNDVYDNTSYNNPGGASQGCPTANISISNVTSSDPQFVDAANHQYAVAPTSPIAGWGLWNGT